MDGHTRFDIPHCLPSARNVTTGKGFGITLTGILVRLFFWNVGLDDACDNSKVGRLLGDALDKAGGVPPN